MTQALVSVVIPAFNAQRWIAATLSSAAAQTHTNLQIVVVDDGSTDRTSEIASEFALNDSRVLLKRQKNQGVAAARNAGIDAADGDYIAFLDADDIWAPQKIELQLAALETAGSRFGLVYNWFRRIDTSDTILPISAYPIVEGKVLFRHIDWNFISNGSTVLVRADTARRVRFDRRLVEQGCEGCEDYLFQLEVSLTQNFVCVPAFLTGYRQTGVSMSASAEQMARSHIKMFEIFRERVPRQAQSVIAERIAEYELTLSILQAKRARLSAVFPLMRALRSSLSGTAASLRTRYCRQRSGASGGESAPFADLEVGQRDGQWWTSKSPRRLKRHARLDQDW